jgi:hypothetical protein
MAFGEHHDNSAARAAKARLLQERADSVETLGGGAVRLQKDLPPGTGWVLSIIGKSWIPKWYLRDRETAIQSVDRYLDRVASFSTLV